MKRQLFIPIEIKAIVTAMKVPFIINSIDEVDGVSTINVQTVIIFNNLDKVMALQEGMIVTIDDINYPVSNIINLPGGKSFDIEATGLSAVEWNVAANFQTGSRYEVNQILDQNMSDLTRFPLIWLLPTTDKDKNQQVLDFIAKVNIVFAHKANDTDRTEKRIENNFDPIIQPLMALFNLWLQSSDFNYMLEFFGYDNPIEYEQSNFAFYGTDDQTKQVITSTATDAIEVNYQLNFKKQFEEPVVASEFELIEGGSLLLLG